MFGYVHPSAEGLGKEDLRRYQSVYCGLCHTLARRYGLFPRLFLNYDMAFLAVLLQPGCESEGRRCIVHPLRRRPCQCACAALDAAADLSVILLWWQIRDGIRDHGAAAGLRYRLAAAALRKSYRKAAGLRPAFDETVSHQITALDKLERENCPTLDAPADCFGRLLACAADAEGEEKRRRVLAHLLYHLGRWIYLADAADDLAKDLRRGAYNPLAYRFTPVNGRLTDEDRATLGQTMDQSVRQMASACELAEFGPYRALVENVVYEGLYLVGGAVLDGTFRRRMRARSVKPDGKAGSADG